MDIFESDINEILKITNEQNNFAKKWFINYSELDETQKNIYDDSSYNFIVKGCAGSGKTILAIHKLYKILSQNKEGFDSYLFTVYAKALLKFIQDGLDIFLKENEDNKNLFKFNINQSNIININRVNEDDLVEKEYLLIDEFQDIGETKFTKLISKFKKIMIFGDDEQQLYWKEDSLTMERVKEILGEKAKVYELSTTYRLPYTIAAFAGEIIGSDIEGKSKYKGNMEHIPNIVECKVADGKHYFKEEIHFIIEEIFNKDLKDVAIIIHNRDAAREMIDIIREKINEIYKRDKERIKPRLSFKIDESIDDLKFLDENSITVMVFHSSKGTQFENVFIPKCDCESIYSTKFNYDRALFVACTRTSKNLYITHSKKLTKFISKIDSEKYRSYEYVEGNMMEKVIK